MGESESSHSTPSGSSRALLDSSGALLEPSTATYDAAACTMRAEGLLHGEADLRQVVVKAVNGVPVVMNEIADIVVGGAPRQGLATMNGDGEVVAGLVLKLTGANTNAVIAAVTERLEAVNAALPEGVVARPYYDQSELVNQAVSTMTTALWQGALLVVVLEILGPLAG